jgi:chromosome segregation ATPase
MDKVINDSKEKLKIKENEYEILLSEKNKLIKEIADLKGKEININKNEIALKKEINNSNLLKNKISELNNNINELNEKIISLEKKNLEYKLNLENNTNSNIRLINNIKNMKKEINNIKNDFIKNFNNLKTKNDETIILL